MLLIKEGAPKAIKEFAEKMAKIWSPSNAYVMDIAETDTGLFIVELNCLNGSGSYAANVSDIISSIENMYINS
jgi:hypothetical protein